MDKRFDASLNFKALSSALAIFVPPEISASGLGSEQGNQCGGLRPADLGLEEGPLGAESWSQRQAVGDSPSLQMTKVAFTLARRFNHLPFSKHSRLTTGWPENHKLKKSPTRGNVRGRRESGSMSLLVRALAPGDFG